MKRTFFTFALATAAFTVNAQSSAGLVAHWDMNGTVSDVSGNGNNGTAYNLTAAAGENGVMGDAWYFNGTNSYILVPYSPSFNLQKYSICATVKVMGFYSGTCEANTIFARGKSGAGTGTYSMVFTETNGEQCVSFDSTVDNFITYAGDFPTSASFNYSPYIAENRWYTVVATFNDSVYNIYVNDTLKHSATPTDVGGLMNSSTDGINIGLNTFEPAFPYAFNGVIDDIRLYNRVLSGSEIITYGTLAVPDVTVSTSRLDIYPNPASSSITVCSEDKITNVAICNLVGQEVYSGQYDAHQVQVDISPLTAGVYFVKINGTDVRKFVKE